MYTLYKFHFLNGISEINQLFDDILIIWPAPVCVYIYIYIYIYISQIININLVSKQKKWQANGDSIARVFIEGW